MYCINYVINKGDTLYSLSRHFNVGVRAIMEANPMINIYNLMVGETICIPMSIPSNNYINVTTYSIKEDDTLGSLLDNSGINLADLLQLNSVDDLYLLPGSTLKIPSIGSGDDGMTL